MSKITYAEANATSLDGLVNDNALVPTLRNGPKPSYQYLVDGWTGEIDALTGNFSQESAEAFNEFDLTLDQYKESRGFNTKGTFADGFTYELPNDVGLDSDGNPWILIDTSSLPVIVSAGTTPSSPTYTQVIYGEASQVSTNTSDTVQSFVDSFSLKIFQSPTDGGLTEIQTRTVNGGEVYEVRKASDDSLATIYSDEDGVTQIVQNGASNVSDSAGVVGFYIADGDYYVEVDSVKSGFNTIKVLSVISKKRFDKSCAPSFVDMHFGILRGTGFYQTETGGSAFYDVVNTVTSGKNVEVTNASNYIVGQLLAYVGIDGLYYSAVVESISGNIITFETPIEIAIPAGNRVYNFYNDQAHPNRYGFRAVADYALKQAISSSVLLKEYLSVSDFFSFGGSTISNDTSVNYTNPSDDSVSITVNNVGGGISTEVLKVKSAGKAVCIVNPNGSTVTLTVREVVGTVATTIASKQIPAGSSPTSVELDFKINNGANVQVFLTSNTVSDEFFIGRVSIYECNSSVPSMEYGKHVLLGDSWFDLNGIYERMIERLPNSDIVNSGIGGNTTQQMIDRFSSDVASHKPDYVWILGGTNDFAQGVTQQQYSRNINTLISKCIEIGAKPILFSASVGAVNHTSFGNLLSISRDYALKTSYQNSSNYESSIIKSMDLNGSVNVPASSRKLIFISQKITKNKALIESLYAVGVGGETTGNVRVGYGPSSIIGLTEDIVTEVLANAVKTDIEIQKSNDSSRFLIVEIQNTSGVAIDVNYSLTVAYYPY